jgi:hypothetical protein
MAALNNIILWILTLGYGVYGVLSLVYFYKIQAQKHFELIPGFDERSRRNIGNEAKFARDNAMPHLLIGLSCIAGVVLVFLYGFSSMAYSIIATLLCFSYGAYVSRRNPERIRRGKYN